VDEDAPLEALMSELRELGDVTLERGRGIVAIVGSALAESTGSLARALAAVGDTRLRMCALSATGTNLTMVVEAAEVPGIMRRLHAEFFE
jgi:aspartokinase